jgi:hypothetical protein
LEDIDWTNTPHWVPYLPREHAHTTVWSPPPPAESQWLRRQELRTEGKPCSVLRSSRSHQPPYLRGQIFLLFLGAGRLALLPELRAGGGELGRRLHARGVMRRLAPARRRAAQSRCSHGRDGGSADTCETRAPRLSQQRRFAPREFIRGIRADVQ